MYKALNCRELLLIDCICRGISEIIMRDSLSHGRMVAGIRVVPRTEAWSYLQVSPAGESDSGVLSIIVRRLSLVLEPAPNCNLSLTEPSLCA